MPIQRRIARSGYALAVAFVALSVFGFGPVMQAAAQDAPLQQDVNGPVQDPPSRVGYVSLIEGTVSMHPNQTDPWAPASLNYPMAAGTSLWTEPGAKAEIQIGAARVDLDGGTEVDIVAVDDQNVELNVPQGRADVHLHGRQPNENYEVTVPRGTVALAADGTYRIIAGDDQTPTRIGALYGNAQLIEPSGAVPVETNNELVVTQGDPLTYTEQPVQDDPFDHWVADRTHRFERPVAHQYVSPRVVGAEDLDQYGSWQQSPQYGSVWYPSGVSADWAPYREGHWAWVAPWGWTWVDDEPWGFAPFHYGRWAEFDGRWGWVPGEVEERPVYAPAMVAFVGGDPGVSVGISVGIGVGVGAAIGWIPLGPGEVYRPPYRVSDNYIRNVNVTNVSQTTINNVIVNKTVNNVTNVTNVTYVNQHAVTAVNHDAFVGARPVRQAALPAAQAATFTHPIVASATPAGRPGAAPLPQPTVASRVGAEAAARPMQAPPQPKLQMPTTHRNAEGHVVPTAVPAVAAAAHPGGNAGPLPHEQAQPHGQAPGQTQGQAPGQVQGQTQPAVARPNGVPQPHPPGQPAPQPSPGPHPQGQAAAPGNVAQPHPPGQPVPQPHPQGQAQPVAAPHPQPVPHPEPQAAPHPQPTAAPHPQPVPHPEPQAAPHPQPAAAPHPQPVPHPEPQAAPHPQPTAAARPQPHPQPQPQPQAQPHPQPTAAPHPQPQPQPQPQHPQPQPQQRPAPHQEEKKDEHPTSFHAPAARPAVQPAHAAPRPAAPQRPPQQGDKDKRPA